MGARSPTTLAPRRWATEDPNPAAKRQEHARLLKEGESGIQVSLDPEFVQRVRELDELEGKVAPRTAAAEIEAGEGQRQLTAGGDDGDEAGEQDGRQAKRARIEAPPAATVVEEQARNNNTAAGPAPTTSTASAAPAAVGGILSGHAVDSLRVLAQLREKRLQEAKANGIAPAPPKSAAPTGLGGLAAYGSDDDSD